MFVDASALAAMLLDERQARLLAGRLQAAANRFTAVPCLLDTLATLSAARGLDAARIMPLFDRFLDAMAIRTVSLPASLAAPAAEAFARFGRSTGLTPNQCLAYAAARYYRVPLLFADPVFAETDIQPG
ncbi:type II toxin-antitoxin system VapC family toxin [Aureimonas leprariae]|uniref:Type II toxin-antitoxin system VapC family toxin n=1 Tax=Plantimonas leprariae TaxID=2615207 RepID=A0A7V7PNJ0_9HYPH|nr:type II toxin-antitoxin system VapC family toxin [Aureimonas leprariae]KAB0679327.1 type II toxin-antitoxin system VapC family toxin [Aureimonas leprariae]